MVLNKQKLEQQIKELADLSHLKYSNLKDIGVLGGQSGVALFQFYCSKYFDDNIFSENGVEIILNCIEKINSGYSSPTYCSGIAGFGWVIQHLNDKDFIELDVDELLEPFDNYLNSQMELDFTNGNYDMLHGALGIGFYFLKRFQGTQNASLRNRYSQILSKCVDYLEQMAITEGEFVKWESVLDYKKGNKGYNLSLSHGMSSIVFFLSRLHAIKIATNRTKKLITGATKFMLSLEKKNTNGISLFPSWIDDNKDDEFNSRLAWCYGDIGLGMVCANAGKTILNVQLEEKGIAILEHSTTRMSKNETLVVDAGFCHGSFGNAHVFNRLLQIKQTEHFENAMEFWLEDGLKKYFKESDEPYKQWNPVDKAYSLEINLLEGVSGIGLSMIDYLAPNNNSWDECLLLR